MKIYDRQPSDFLGSIISGTAARGVEEEGGAFSTVGKIYQRYEMSSSLINSANVPVAKNHRHLNFG